VYNPTQGKIRRDGAGQGHYGAARGDRKHKGVDLECIPGQPVCSPIEGKIVRVAYPYEDTKKYSGVVVENGKIRVKLFYLHPIMKKIGKQVHAGDHIGTAQDITKRYPDAEMIPHIHLEIDSVDPMIFIEMP